MGVHGTSPSIPTPADAAPITAARFEASDRHLRRAIPFQSLLFLSMGAIIGSGWLFGSLKTAAVAGPAAVISWAVGGVFVICISLA